jgi:hypothetical protein
MRGNGSMDHSMQIMAAWITACERQQKWRFVSVPQLTFNVGCTFIAALIYLSIVAGTHHTDTISVSRVCRPTGGSRWLSNLSNIDVVKSQEISRNHKSCS